jgi:hypothetical protein
MVIIGCPAADFPRDRKQADVGRRFMQEEGVVRFSSAMPVVIYTRPQNDPDQDWQEFDRGPGFFSVPVADEIRVRIKGINNEDLHELVKELVDVETLRFLDLSENRNITNEGLARLKALPQLTGLNLSSCSITSFGLTHLKDLPRLEYLNLSYCNRLADEALKTLESMRNLTDVNMLGCLSITNGGLARVRRRNLTIHR